MEKNENPMPLMMIPASMTKQAYNQWYGIAKTIIDLMKEQFNEMESSGDKICGRTQYLFCWVGEEKIEIPSLAIPRDQMMSVIDPVQFLRNKNVEATSERDDLTKNIAIIETDSYYYCIPVLGEEDNVLEKPLFKGHKSMYEDHM